MEATADKEERACVAHRMAEEEAAQAREHVGVGNALTPAAGAPEHEQHAEGRGRHTHGDVREGEHHGHHGVVAGDGEAVVLKETEDFVCGYVGRDMHMHTYTCRKGVERWKCEVRKSVNLVAHAGGGRLAWTHRRPS